TPRIYRQVLKSPIMEPVRGAGTGFVLGSGLDLGMNLTGYDTGEGFVGRGGATGMVLGALSRNPLTRRLSAAARRKAVQTASTNPTASKAYSMAGRGLQGAHRTF